MTVADASYDARGKDTAEIEHDIAATRAELGTVLDALERRLAPRQLVEKGMEMMKGTIEENASAVGNAVRAHPVPLALIGAGIGWFVVAATGGGRLGERVAGAARQAADSARSFTGSAAEQVAASAPYEMGEEMAGYAYARAKPSFAAAADAASRAAAGARYNVGTIVDQYPLALGLVGLAAGVAVGLLLPRSRMEERVIAPARERFKEEASALGREAVEQARAAAGRAADAAADAIRDEAHKAAPEHDGGEG